MIKKSMNRFNKFLSTLAISGFLACFSVTSSAKDIGRGAESDSIDRAVATVYPALVRIAVVMEEGEDGRMKKLQGVGSGSIISADGYVLTNHHVAGHGTRFMVRLSNREDVDATLVGTDALADLAVIKLDLATRRNPGEPLPVAKFGDSDKLKVGDVVLAMGSPGGLSQSVTKGIVANTEMIAPKNMGGLTLDGERIGELVRWIGHDAVIFGGNSGGPLVNLDGEIIGVNEVGIASLGGAIPSNLAKKVSAELIAKGSVTRSWIGLEVQPLLRGMTKERGVLVSGVLKGSPADQAGMKHGDFVIEFNGQPVTDCWVEEDLPVFNAMVLNTPVGTKIQIKGLRDGQPQNWEVTTLERSPNQGREAELRGWGLTASNLTRLSALERRRKDTSGVLVHSIKSGGPCAEAKPPLLSGDVITAFNQTTISDVASLDAASKKFVSEVTSPKRASVAFSRGRQDLITVIKIGPEPAEQNPKQAEKAWLGASIQVLIPELADALSVTGKKGVRVTSVAPGSPASKADIKPGDLLFKADGQVISTSRPEDQEAFETLIRAHEVGGEITFDGLREGQPVKLSATLGRRPSDEAEVAQVKDERFEFTACNLSSTQRMARELDEDNRGVLVEKVTASGWAALAGLRNGDVLISIDGEPLSEIDTLRRKLDQLAEAKPRRTVFLVQRGIHNLYLEVEPKWQ